MPSKTTYQDKLRECRYPIDEHPENDIVTHYYRGRITPNWVKVFNEIEDLQGEDANSLMAVKFVDVTHDWNFTETDAPGSPTIPITVEDAMDLGMALIGGLIHKYIEACQDPEVEAVTQPAPLQLRSPQGRKGSMVG